MNTQAHHNIKFFYTTASMVCAHKRANYSTTTYSFSRNLPNIGPSQTLARLEHFSNLPSKLQETAHKKVDVHIQNSLLQEQKKTFLARGEKMPS